MAPDSNPNPGSGDFNPDDPSGPGNPPAATSNPPAETETKAKGKGGVKRTFSMGGVKVDMSISIAKGKGKPGFGPGSQAIETICRQAMEYLRNGIDEALK